MRFASLLAILLSFLLAAPAAQGLGARHWIRDGEALHEFEIALDEVHYSTPDRPYQLRAIPQVHSTDDLVRTAAQMARSLAGEVNLVLYPAGVPREEVERRFLSNRLVVNTGTADPARIASEFGVTYRGKAPGGLPGYSLFEATGPAGALLVAEKLQADKRIPYAQPELAHQQSKRWAPNDPLFPIQWHLANSGSAGGVAGVDANLTAVWGTFRGSGIRIGIVDDGMQISHPDLAPNADTVNDRDWNDATPDDPSPDVTKDFHGSSCSGVAAGCGNNGLGISGAAPEATLVGLRLIGAATTDSQEAEALSYRSDIIPIKSNSWGPADLGRLLAGPGPLAKAALADAAATGRGGKGTIFLWAGGNGGNLGDNSNYDGYANSIYTIAIGALTNTGSQAYYSEPGANLVVTAPSSGGTVDIVTTDLVGENGYNNSTVAGELPDRNYTNAFGGTSSATPLVAGCVALMLQANPNLGWRDVQEILIRTATKIAPTDSDWVTNGAGLQFNHKFGAGLINAGAAVSLAQTWTNLAPQVSATASRSGATITIPDNNATGLTGTFDFSNTRIRVEQVTVTVDLAHNSRGQLAVTLTSPSGVSSRLAERHNDSGNNYANWTFSTVRNWGENSKGNWRLTVADLVAGTVGTAQSATIVIYGTPINQPPSITGALLSTGSNTATGDPITIQNLTSQDPDGDPVSVAYQWEQSADNVTFTPIVSATSSTLATGSFSGLAIRCRLTPSDLTATGTDFLTAVTFVNNRPYQLAQVGQPYTYDSDLFLSGTGSQFRFGAASDLVPGLTIDASSGLVSGTPANNASGLYNLILERYRPGFSATQTFGLLVADVNGNSVIQGGKSFTLNQDYTLPGNLLLLGSLDTGGKSLEIPGTLSLNGTLLNLTGTISYLRRDGQMPTGNMRLLGTTETDLADNDGDGISNLMEFALGGDPSQPDPRQLPVVSLQPTQVSGSTVSRLTLTYAAPVGALGINYTVEVASVPGLWNSGPTQTEKLSDIVTSGTRTVTFRDLTNSGTATQRSIRLRVNR